MLIALGGLAVVFLHRQASRNLLLTSEPGTIAAAIALGGQSDMSHLLQGQDTEEEMRAMLADLKFTIDPVSSQVPPACSSGFPFFLCKIFIQLEPGFFSKFYLLMKTNRYLINLSWRKARADTVKCRGRTFRFLISPTMVRGHP